MSQAVTQRDLFSADLKENSPLEGSQEEQQWTADAQNLRMISGPSKPFLPFRNSVHLAEQEAYELMQEILSGGMETAAIAHVLTYLRDKGETVSEVVGFARAIRERAEPISIGPAAGMVLDTCGTGGDGTNTFNISTTAAFVVAGSGVVVAKHGNRRISSQCGSADVLEKLGVAVDLPAAQIAECIQDCGMAFIFAPLAHPAIKHAQPARLQLKGRTVFNLLGPLTNPVRTRVQLIGAFSIRAAELLAHAAARLGIERAFVVHGADGLDEISTAGQTTVFQVEDGRVQKGLWSPLDFGLPIGKLEDLAGGDADTNAEIIRSLLGGEQGSKRDIVVANAAAALLAAGRATDLKSAVEVAKESLDSGAAEGKLNELVACGSRMRHEVV